ncbi:MAG: NAD(P)-dependent oxidoreductase [Candidatus Omnitrophica bacterium]|nr:NAD(P)-dependent oxidoreductase [Candidatus Omnitrophota bacterium]MDE2223588.1 NAD(P)-dependent oxidoreductase [Candidatus Omnitrophota bacterium]
MKSKIMIWGINGFTGWHFQRYIQRKRLTDKYAFVGVDQSIRKIMDIDYVRADLCQDGQCEKLIKRHEPDYVINLAGLLRAEAMEDMIRVNVQVSRTLLDVVLRQHMPVKKILLIGSAAEYGFPPCLPVPEDTPPNPVNPYGLSKVIQSQFAHYYFKNHAVPVVIARTFNVIGRHISPFLSVGSFLNQIRNVKNGGAIHVGNLETRRDFIDIADVVEGYWKLLFRGRNGGTYNLCRGESVLIKDILQGMIERSRKNIKIVVRSENLKQGDVLDIYGDNTKIKQDTGWRPRIDMNEALDRLFSNDHGNNG